MTYCVLRIAYPKFNTQYAVRAKAHEVPMNQKLDKNLALTDAIVHIKKFWRTYLQAYEDKYNER